MSVKREDTIKLIGDIYIFKVKDYTTILVGQYDTEKNEFYVQRGDGAKYSYSNHYEFGRIEWFEKLNVNL